MPSFVFKTETSTAVVEADSWLQALAQAERATGFDLHTGVVADVRHDGVIRLTGEDGHVRAVAMGWTSDKPIEAGLEDRLLTEPDSEGADATTPQLDDEISVPAPAVPPADVLEILARELPTLTGLDEAQAMVRAMELADVVAPCTGQAVLIDRLDDPGLTFEAVAGPHADQVRELILPRGQGLAGWVHRTGRALIVNDIALSHQHLHHLDKLTGYSPVAVLAAPIRDAAGYAWGVLELSDEDKPFAAWQVEVVRRIASALAEVLSAHATR